MCLEKNKTLEVSLGDTRQTAAIYFVIFAIPLSHLTLPGHSLSGRKSILES